MNIYDKLYDLCNSIKNSDEFIRYKKAAEKVDADPKHSEMLKDFISAQVQLTSMQMFGQQPDEETIEHFNTLYATIAAISDINEFLQAQSYFSRIMDDVNRELSQAVSVNAKFMDVIPKPAANEANDEPKE